MEVGCWWGGVGIRWDEVKVAGEVVGAYGDDIEWGKGGYGAMGKGIVVKWRGVVIWIGFRRMGGDGMLSV